MNLTEAATHAAMSAEKSHNYNLHLFTVIATDKDDDYTKRMAESTSQIEKCSAFAGLILFRQPLSRGKA